MVYRIIVSDDERRIDHAFAHVEAVVLLHPQRRQACIGGRGVPLGGQHRSVVALGLHFPVVVR